MDVTDATTHSNGQSLAYQTWGKGDLCFLIVPEWTVVGSVSWRHPGVLRSWRRFSRMGRCARFDRPGIGGSELPDHSDPTHPMHWARAATSVIDALGWREVIVVCEGSAGQAGLLAAVDDPRVTRMMFANGYLRLDHGDGSSLGLALDAIADRARAEWGNGHIISAGSPTIAGDDTFIDFCAENERAACDAKRAAEFMRSLGAYDVSDSAARSTHPALVIHTGDLPWITIDHCRELAASLPNAQLELIPSETFYGDPRLNETIQAFVLGEPIATDRRRLAMLFTDVVASTERAARAGDKRWRTILEDLDAFTNNEVRRGGGRVVTRTGDGCLAAFEGATEAVTVARKITQGAPVLGVEIRAGVHVGEVEVRDDGDVAGLDVHIAARVAAIAVGGEVLFSPSVVNELNPITPVIERGTYDLKGVPGQWRLFSLGN